FFFYFFFFQAEDGIRDLIVTGVQTCALPIYPAIHLVGQTSGTVWMIDAARTHPMYHDNVHGAGESFEGVTNEYYTNASGAQLHLRNNVHLTVTGQGRIALERPLVWDCIGG